MVVRVGREQNPEKAEEYGRHRAGEELVLRRYARI